MLTFDDTDEEQYSIGAAEMNKYDFKGVYFVMTISINRPRYMSNDQLKTLSENGHTNSSPYLGSSYGYQICWSRL